jgi:hypothetical protein
MEDGNLCKDWSEKRKTQQGKYGRTNMFISETFTGEASMLLMREKLKHKLV